MMRRLAGLLAVALCICAAPNLAAAQAGDPDTTSVQVTVWRSVSNTELLYVSTRPQGGRWRTENTPLDMSGLSRSRRYHQSNAVLVEVGLGKGDTVTVEVTVWRPVTNPALLYVSTRPEGGRWRTENTALDMSGLSRSGDYQQSNAVFVEVALEQVAPADTTPAPHEVTLSNNPPFKVRVAELRFYEGGRAHPPRNTRVYSSVFNRQAVRFLNWEVSLAFPEATQSIDFEIEATFWRPDGEAVRQIGTFSIKENWTRSWHSKGRGGDKPPLNWPVGSYRVDLSVNGDVIASGGFQLVDTPVPETGSFARVRDTLDWGPLSDSFERRASLLALAELHNADEGLAAAAASWTWVQQEPGVLQRRTLQQLAALVHVDIQLTKDVATLTWLADGLTDDEWLTARALTLLAMEDTSLARLIAQFKWLQDDVTALERETLEELVGLAALGGGSVLGMPFLSTLSPADSQAVTSLRSLATTDPDVFHRILRAPSILDGITDDEAKVVLTLDQVLRAEPEAFDRLLDMTGVALEERVVGLESGEEVLITLIRAEAGAARTMDFAAEALASTGNFMGYAPPGKHVVLLIGKSLTSSTATRRADHIVVAPKLDSIDYSSYRLFRTLAHEFTHLYWPGVDGWVDEGLANATAALSVAAFFGTNPHPYEPPCYLTSGIVEWLAVKSLEGNSEASCDYSLGERLFLGLHRGLGDPVYRDSIRELNRMNASGPANHECGGDALSICHIDSAFRSAITTQEEFRHVEAIIKRWYHGEGADDLSHLDASPADPQVVPGVVTITDAYVSLGDDRAHDAPVDTFSASDFPDSPRLVLEWSVAPTSDPKVIPLVLVEAFQDGLTFTRRETTRVLEPDWTAPFSRLPIGVPRLQEPWATGLYFVYVYHEGRKVAEVTYEVTP